MNSKQIILLLCLPLMAKPASGQQVKLNKAGATAVELQIIYDNYVATPGTTADWGFACAIDINDQQILFDTGTNPKTLVDNINILDYDLKSIDQIVISHDHHDHIGGLKRVLSEIKNIPVYLPEGAAKQLTTLVEEAGGQVEAHILARKIADHVWLSGTMGDQIREQCLVINHKKGLIIITGCSHPGIVEMLDSIKNRFGKEIYAVIGGFHLMQHSQKQINEIIADFEELGVSHCGCTHCTGDRQIGWFKAAYGERFLEMGVGRRMVF